MTTIVRDDFRSSYILRDTPPNRNPHTRTGRPLHLATCNTTSLRAHASGTEPDAALSRVTLQLVPTFLGTLLW